MWDDGYTRTEKSRRPRIGSPGARVPGVVRRRLRPVRRRTGGEQGWDALVWLRGGAWGVGRVGAVSGQVADARYRPHSHAERRYLVLAGALKSATWPARVRAAGAARAWTGGSPGTTGRPRGRLPGRLRPRSSPAPKLPSAQGTKSAGQDQMKPPYRKGTTHSPLITQPCAS